MIGRQKTYSVQLTEEEKKLLQQLALASEQASKCRTTSSFCGSICSGRGNPSFCGLINYFKPKLNGTNNPDASDRLTVYFSDDTTLKKLEEWAKEENRSASNLAATLLAKAAQDKDKQEKSA